MKHINEKGEKLYIDKRVKLDSISLKDYKHERKIFVEISKNLIRQI